MSDEQKEDKTKPKVVITRSYSTGVIDSGSPISTISALSGSIAEGYNQLSSTFSVNQANIAKSFDLEENVKQLVDLTKEQVVHSQKESKNRRNQWIITTAIALCALIISVLKALNII